MLEMLGATTYAHEVNQVGTNGARPSGNEGDQHRGYHQSI